MANVLRVKFIKTHWDYKQLPGEFASLREDEANMLIALGCAVLAPEESTSVVPDDDGEEPTSVVPDDAGWDREIDDFLKKRNS
jgi:hypothetical protein